MERESKTFSHRSLIEYGTFTSDDYAHINNCRKAHNRLGFGYQLIFIRLFNAKPQILPFELIDELVHYASMQLIISEQFIKLYINNRKTIADHQNIIVTFLKISEYNAITREKLENHIFIIAQRLEATSILKTEAIQYLRSEKILSPTEEQLKRSISFQRKRARSYIFSKIHSQL